MKTFIIRSITGLLYAGAIASSIFMGHVWFASLFFVFMLFSLYEFYKLFENSTFHPQKTAGLLIAAIYYVSTTALTINLIQTSYLLINLLGISFLFIYELFRQKGNPFINLGITLTGLFYIAFPLSLFNFLFENNSHAASKEWLILGIFAMIWLNDTFAYIIGSLFGKHKLWERISPKKSWEGTIGGAFFTITAGIFWSMGDKQIALYHWVIIASIIIVFGTMGDLLESYLKRSLQIKDSSKILPGHGGFLDRLDSILIALPLVFLYICFMF